MAQRAEGAGEQGKEEVQPIAVNGEAGVAPEPLLVLEPAAEQGREAGLQRCQAAAVTARPACRQRCSSSR